MQMKTCKVIHDGKTMEAIEVARMGNESYCILKNNGTGTYYNMLTVPSTKVEIIGDNTTEQIDLYALKTILQNVWEKENNNIKNLMEHGIRFPWGNDVIKTDLIMEIRELAPLNSGYWCDGDGIPTQFYSIPRMNHALVWIERAEKFLKKYAGSGLKGFKLYPFKPITKHCLKGNGPIRLPGWACLSAEDLEKIINQVKDRIEKAKKERGMESE